MDKREMKDTDIIICGIAKHSGAKMWLTLERDWAFDWGEADRFSSTFAAFEAAKKSASAGDVEVSSLQAHLVTTTVVPIKEDD